ncbi:MULTISPECIES: hypothetical protein [unclassified Sphingomonas]|uniref:hypothetical protein n=1 Tax=unclassified Sphingomonas TaxID=196159 RepID=UPI002150F253|nr:MULTISPECIES: hypothetical protein [unclassified Sphingomonas]MCR5870303.1 hypothetical protein [Sphingomonas sp. J344]UUX98015.1 hypothetical protein LRS08_10220 [Sphingomonas sp. J315]
MRLLLWMGAVALLSGCGGELSNDQQAALVENAIANAEAAAQNVTREARRDRLAERAPQRDAWIGKWVGVEGLVLEIAKGDEPGRYRITNSWSLDEGDTGTFDGRASEDGIVFRRGETRVELVAGDGDATGMKWLAGKKDCLIVAPGEGYCRD